MTLFVPPSVHNHSTHEVVTNKHSWNKDKDVRLETHEVTDDILVDLATVAKSVGEKSFLRVVESIQRARTGNFDKSVPNLRAFPQLFEEFLRHHKIDGWLYRQASSTGRVEAFLVESVKYDEGRGPDDKPSVTVFMVNTGVLESSDRSERQGRGLSGKTMHLNGSEVTNKKIVDVLTDAGYLVETDALRKVYDAQTAHHLEVLRTGFTEQYRFTGLALLESDGDTYPRSHSISERVSRKVINDTQPAKVNITDTATSKVFTDDAGDSVRLPVPMAHLVKVFDLATHTFLVVHTTDLTTYKYDSSLATKLVLPNSHRDLLDILTTDIATFTGDIIEGKSAGNVILAKGAPGVGKTLTAEVYSELIERPLYSIHSGALGITADSIRKNLETVFKRAKRWNAVLLLDEADVFVMERGTDITQNAIVAEFLRTLEYFDGLMFMTTNRAANIDEAILSRTAAIISYSIPGAHDQARIWDVLATNFGVTLDPALIADLTAGLPGAAPRDVKMLLRLALRVASSEGKDLDVEIVQRSSMFRGVTWDDEAYEQHLRDNGRWDDEGMA